jgi:hypothetical protein
MPDANVLILGCGPSGLLAAHAVERLGGEPVIMSRKTKSVLPGAQYLHEPIPDLHDPREPDGVIRTIRRGTAEGYASKVYGCPDAPTSWGLAPEETAAWDLRATYDLLWYRYQDRIEDTEITREDLWQFSRSLDFDLVISSIWAPSLCAPEWRRPTEGIGDHRFEHEKMYVIDWAPPEVEDNTVLYSGDPDHEWYRCSRVFGHASSEATNHSLDGSIGYLQPDARRADTLLRVKTGIKVVGTTCDCFPQIKRVGRYGTWRRGYLTHHAFADATNHYNARFAA